MINSGATSSTASGLGRVLSPAGRERLARALAEAPPREPLPSIRPPMIEPIEEGAYVPRPCKARHSTEGDYAHVEGYDGYRDPLPPIVLDPATEFRSGLRAALGAYVRDHPGRVHETYIRQIAGITDTQRRMARGILYDMQQTGELHAKRVRNTTELHPPEADPRALDGVVLSYADLEDHERNVHGFTASTIQRRVEDGMSVAEALATPKRRPGPPPGRKPPKKTP